LSFELKRRRRRRRRRRRTRTRTTTTTTTQQQMWRACVMCCTAIRQSVQRNKKHKRENELRAKKAQVIAGRVLALRLRFPVARCTSSILSPL
jgi:hypothetical protein